MSYRTSHCIYHLGNECCLHQRCNVIHSKKVYTVKYILEMEDDSTIPIKISTQNDMNQVDLHMVISFLFFMCTVFENYQRNISSQKIVKNNVLLENYTKVTFL